MIKRIIKDFNVVDICIIITTLAFIFTGVYKAKWNYDIKIKELEKQTAFASRYGVEDLSKEQIDAIMDIVQKKPPKMPGYDFLLQISNAVMLVPDSAPVVVLNDIKRIYPTINIVVIPSPEMDEFLAVYRRSGRTTPVGLTYMNNDGDVVSTMDDKK